MHHEAGPIMTDVFPGSVRLDPELFDGEAVGKRLNTVERSSSGGGGGGGTLPDLTALV